MSLLLRKMAVWEVWQNRHSMRELKHALLFCALNQTKRAVPACAWYLSAAPGAYTTPDTSMQER